MEYKSVQITKDYSSFAFSIENRDVNLKKSKAKKLRKSLKDHGWIPSFPMTVYKNGDNKLKILDGQHRFSIARELGIPVKYVEVDQEIDIAQLNDTQDTWSLKDYLSKWLKVGKEEYNEIVDFMNEHPSIGLSWSYCLLIGRQRKGTLLDNFKDGKFNPTNKSKKWAYKVGESYERMVSISNSLRHENSLKALSMCFHVDDFEPKRLVDNFENHTYLIQPCSKVDDWLELFEEVYNYRRRTGKIPLKFMAKEIIRERAGH